MTVSPPTGQPQVSASFGAVPAVSQRPSYVLPGHTVPVTYYGPMSYYGSPRPAHPTEFDLIEERPR
ncbi:hypothetical protein SEA_NERGAL_64 [Mycobacterium Phage Nergal]|nr:hypothetical protein SEA_NERGAL_64 [Mycobacterium Phage Nergal]